jgi:diguanylate cyclase
MPVRPLTDGSRLAAVRDTGLPDSEEYAQLERLNRLATELLGVPISLVTIVGEDRQFFAGQIGLPEPWASFRETPLSHSFCQHVIERDAPVVVADTHNDPLAAGNLAVRDMGVVAYAGVPLRLSDGSVLGAFCAIDDRPHRWTSHDVGVLADLAELARDVIELRRDRARPELRDPLTSLPDRAMFAELIERALAQASRDGCCTSVIAVDIDGFRLVNEALGHAAGDEVLRGVASRLEHEMRGNDAVCRLGGDVFLVLCDSARDEADALRIAERLRRTVCEESFCLGGEAQQLGMTVGVACSIGNSDSDDLIDAALAGLAIAKRGLVESNSEHRRARPRAEAAQRLQLRNDISLAAQRDELHLVYQPVIDLRSGRIAKLEALMRWQHPVLGAVGPNAFIPAAELSGAIVQLGEWALMESIKDFCRWQSAGHEGELSLAVNVAPLQLRTANFVEIVAAALDTCSLPGSILTLEITERTVLDERIAQASTLERLRELGIKLALDDFGTGYSALGYLTRVPVDVIKIDRSFIATVDSDRRSAALVKGILAISEGMQLRSVAEGIETQAQLASVRGMGCDYGQGYLLGRPVCAAEIGRLLDAAAIQALG